MIRVAIVGCGKIADQHATQIRRIEDCTIVAACDREPLMAQQLGDRFGVAGVYADVADMLSHERPDVVHVTTSPDAHFALGRQCLEAGANVYIEKPFTLNAGEAEGLIGLAEKKGLRVTVGHNAQFSHASTRMRALVGSGYLGGPPVHMESLYCYDLGGGYAKSFLGDSRHWLRRLPGKLLQNLISHGVSRIAEFITADRPHVVARAFVSPGLRDRGETEIMDELRVMIDADTTTAYLTFSSRIGPSLNEFRLYGPRNSLIVDQEHQTLLKVEGDNYKVQLKYFLTPLRYGRLYRRNAIGNVRKFLRFDLHMDAGMKSLIETFYKSIAEGSAPPIPYREILLVARIMDDIFSQTGTLA
jgi:predicted dehydrogenase